VAKMKEHICLIVWPSGRPWCRGWTPDGHPNHGCMHAEQHTGDHTCRCGDTKPAAYSPPRLAR
jgi:hypothetical protein